MPAIPSLRRTISYPARPAPYPTSPDAQIKARRGPESARRGREVLAEIEWWKVMAGQRPDDEDDEQADTEEDEPADDTGVVVAAANVLSSITAADRLEPELATSTLPPLPLLTPSSTPVTPQTPTRSRTLLHTPRTPVTPPSGSGRRRLLATRSFSGGLPSLSPKEQRYWDRLLTPPSRTKRNSAQARGAARRL